MSADDRLIADLSEQVTDLQDDVEHLRHQLLAVEPVVEAARRFIEADDTVEATAEASDEHLTLFLSWKTRRAELRHVVYALDATQIMGGSDAERGG